MTFQGHFFSVDSLTDSILEASFPGINREEHYRRMDAWLHTHPLQRPKKHYDRFIYKWLSRNVGHIQTEAQVGEGPAAGFGRCKNCGERFMTHAESCDHEC